MTETTKQNFSILLITFLIAGTVFLVASFIKPAFDENRELAATIQETKNNIVLLQEYQAKSASLIQDYLNLGSQVDNINLSLPDNAQTAQVLAVLDALAQEAGITLSSLTFRETMKGDQSQLEIEMKFSASYENFKSFINEMEKELRIIDLTESNIKAVASSKSDILEFDLTLVTYFLSYGD